MWMIVFIFSLWIQFSVPAFLTTYISAHEDYHIAGIFTKSSTIQRNAFNESSISATYQNRRLQAVIIEPIRADSYSAWRALCNKKGVQPVAIFGPQDEIADGAVRDQCALVEIPHIQAAWQPYDPDLELITQPAQEEIEKTDPEDTLEGEEPGEEEEKTEESEVEDEMPKFKKITINFFPDSDEISIAFANLLKYYRWESFAVLYEDEFGLLRIQKILALMTTEFPVVVRKLDPDGDNYNVLKDLLAYQQSRFLLDCHVDRIKKYIEIAGELDMLNHYQHYIFMSLDTGIVADENWVLNVRSNVTFLSLTKFEELQDPQNRLASRVGKWKATGGSPPVNKFPLESLIIDDVANHVVQAVKNVEIKVANDAGYTDSSLLSTTQFACGNDANKWEYGALVQHEILNTTTMGITGNVQFDDNGKRINYILYVTEKQVKQKVGEPDVTCVFESIARWNSDTQQIIDDRNETEIVSADINRHTFKIIAKVSKPFFSKVTCDGKECPEDYDGPKYEGFSVDLVDNIVQILKREEGKDYDYEFIYDQTIDYGEYDTKTKKWNGLIGQLLDKKADLAVCDLTITEQRKNVVDFSVPIMSLGISILYIQERQVSPDTFSFLYPYSIDVWMYIGTAYCIVSVVLYLCARISPADWENPQPCDKDPEELENIWNFKNCAWLTMGSIMTQGCDILPKAFGSRWVCSMWWFFAMIVCQSYIAQLSASMTSALENEPLNGVEDLPNQNKIRFGAIKGGSTLEFFKRSKDKTYKTIYEVMSKNPALLVKTNDEGEKRVISGNGKYAFFMESSNIDYKLKRNCNLKKVGDLLDSKDYGIAMPANSPFRKIINNAILKLKELTILSNITDKWWNEMYGAKDCSAGKEDAQDDIEGDMELENLVGLFLLTVLGLIISVLITAGEFMNEVRNIVVREQVSHKEAFVKELRASLNFSQTQKPVLRNPSRAPSMVNSEKIEVPLNPEEKKERRSAALENFLEHC
ncbi:glutamate receptor ionotropic, kainate 2-like [Hyposmocoma kahamanoa]|uniref:glutamate receptor ionotropic, kainate 2-like n=1 Tax=Hyposmocoma kahamanoa TaxID=1477025 RepID=UPI000E6D7938|nr:glutamate receptor ionotropic, kainate 2-like [Hyposmocoma kahamanoa]